jgi:AraC family transcriptional regulator
VCCTAPKSRAGREEHSERAGFIFPRRGLFSWHSQGSMVVADPATALFVGNHRVYRIEHPVQGGDDCTTLRIAPEMLFDAIQAPLNSFRSVVLSSAAQRCIQLLIHKMRMRQSDTLLDEDLAFALLGTVCAEFGASDGLRANTNEIADVRCLIASHPEERLSLSEIAKAVNVSPYHLARRFRYCTGTSIHQYRTRLRLALAIERISEGWTDLSSLALDLGFAHHSHFTSSFRKAYGILPSELRQVPDRKTQTASKVQPRFSQGQSTSVGVADCPTTPHRAARQPNEKRKHPNNYPAVGRSR